MNQMDKLKLYKEFELFFADLMLLDDHLLNEQVVLEVSDFISHGEYGLAYDILAYQFESKAYQPSNNGLIRLIQISQLLGVVFPMASS